MCVILSTRARRTMEDVHQRRHSVSMRVLARSLYCRNDFSDDLNDLNDMFSVPLERHKFCFSFLINFV